jgi:hypothetical protein
MKANRRRSAPLNLTLQPDLLHVWQIAARIDLSSQSNGIVHSINQY